MATDEPRRGWKSSAAALSRFARAVTARLVATALEHAPRSWL